MTVNQVKDMADFVGLFEGGHKANPPALPTDVIELVGAYDVAAKPDTLVWDIWRRDFAETEKYPFIDDNKPTLMLYTQGKVGRSTYSAGVAFTINLNSVIKEIQIDATKKQIIIKVNKNAFFWRYNRINRESIKKVFRNFSVVDFTVGSSVTNQMDSQTPSHPKGGQLGGGHEG